MSFFTCVVHDREVRVLRVVLSASGFGSAEVGRLAEVVVLQLLLEGLVGGFRKHGLLFQDGENSERLDVNNKTSYLKKGLHATDEDHLLRTNPGFWIRS